MPTTDLLDPITDQIISIEGTGQNRRSSAVGQGQFIGSTWRNMIRKHAPELAAGKTDDQINALRTDPNYAGLGRQMTRAYARDNQGILQGAGFDISPGNTYLAHFAGPGGAIKILSADPNASAARILGKDATEANPFLRDMTAGQLQAWAARKMAPANQVAALPGEAAPTTAPADPTALESAWAGTPGLMPPAPQTSPAPGSGQPGGLLAGMIPAASPVGQVAQGVSSGNAGQAIGGLLGMLGGMGGGGQMPQQQPTPFLRPPQLQPIQFAQPVRRPVQLAQVSPFYGGGTS